MNPQGRLLIAATVLGGLLPSTVRAANQLITDFTYQSCGIGERADHCVEVKAPKAWLSQLRSSTHIGFSTSGISEVRLLDSKGEVKSHVSAIEATLHAELGVLALDFADGTAMLISLDSGKIEKIGAAMGKERASGEASGEVRPGGKK